MVVWQGSAGDRRPYADQVAIGEVRKFGLHGIEGDGLPGGRFTDEEAVADVLGDGLHRERRETVPDTGPPRLPTSRTPVS